MTGLILDFKADSNFVRVIYVCYVCYVCDIRVLCVLYTCVMCVIYVCYTRVMNDFRTKVGAVPAQKMKLALTSGRLGLTATSM